MKLASHSMDLCRLLQWQVGWHAGSALWVSSDLDLADSGVPLQSWWSRRAILLRNT